MPVTVIACVVPAGSETGLGKIVKDVSNALVTVTDAEPVIEFSVAVTETAPAPAATSNPLEPAVLLIVALLGSEVLQCAEVVTLC